MPRSFLCSVPSCNRPRLVPRRSPIAVTHCRRHMMRLKRYGHPEAQVLRRQAYRVYAVRMLKLIASALRDPEYPQRARVVNALDTVRNIMALRAVIPPKHPKNGKGRRAECLVPAFLARRELDRIIAAGVTPEDVLAEAVGVFTVLWWVIPGWLPDDTKCLNMAMGRAVFKLAPARRHFVRPPGTATLYLGERIRREACGHLLHFSMIVHPERDTTP